MGFRLHQPQLQRPLLHQLLFPHLCSATLSLPENNKVCETGTNASTTQSTILFQWVAATNATAYDLRITNSDTQGVTLINNIEGTQREVTLEKGMPYAWQITSKATGTNETAQSPAWKFYLAGDGVENYAPFPADLLSPASGGTVSVSESGKISLSWSGEDPDGWIAGANCDKCLRNQPRG